MTIIFPDSELWLTGALRSVLTDVYVSTTLPYNRRPREVIVRRDGGPERFITANQRFGVRVFAATPKEVTDLAEETSARLRDLQFEGPVRRVTTTSPFAVEDASGVPCRYLSADITVRGAPLTVP